MQTIDAQLIDMVDANDQVIGTIRRGDVFAQRANFRVVHGFVFNPASELLLQHIAPQRRHPLMWGSSVAGYVASGESYDEAIARKVRDELGQPGLPLGYFGKTSMVDEGCIKFIALYTGQSSGPFTPDRSQIAELHFFSLGEIQVTRQQGTMAFTPTFLHLLDFYTGGHGRSSPTS